MSHDNSFPILQKLFNIGASKVHDPRQIVFTLDHSVQDKSETNLKKYAFIEEFARTHGIDFYGKLLSAFQQAGCRLTTITGAGRGIGHQIMVEQGYVWPNTLVRKICPYVDLCLCR